MTEIDLSQSEANTLLEMKKRRMSDTGYRIPGGGQKLSVPLESLDSREHFLLDMHRSKIALSKFKIQNRVRESVILARLDLGGSPHVNPDGNEVPTPHLHVFREGYGDKWAFAPTKTQFPSIGNEWATIWDFMRFCNIVEPPSLQRSLI